MSSPVSAQASKLWQLLTAPSTASAYQQAFGVTKTILQETAQLLWLLFCLILVAGDWFWRKSIAAGQYTRSWVNDLLEPKDRAATPTQTASQVWENFLASSKTLSTSLLTTAKQQLDLPTETPSTPATPTQSATPAIAPPVPPAVESPKPVSKPDSDA